MDFVRCFAESALDCFLTAAGVVRLFYASQRELCRDGGQQGFVVGEIFTDGYIYTRAVIVPISSCMNKMISLNASEDDKVYV